MADSRREQPGKTSKHDPLNLHEYMMNEARTPKLESLMNPSPSPSLGSGNSPRYNDLAWTTANSFPRPFPSHRLSPPRSTTNGVMSLNGSDHSILNPSTDLHAQSRHFVSGANDARGSQLSPGQSMPRTTSMEILAEASEIASTAERQNQQSKRKTSEVSKDKDGDKEKEDQTPAWAEMKTKAGKDRKRLPLACIACRRKKIRCSGEKPACKHCLRSRIPCVYKVTTRKAAPRTDYMAMLDKRLKRMEDRVIKLIPKENQSAVPRAVVRPALPTPSGKLNGKKRGADEAFGVEPDLDKWSNSRHGSKVEVGTMKAPEAEERNLLSEGAESMPSREMQEHLAEVYFDYVYGQSYPLLHKPSFMARLAAGNVAPVLVLAVCAISARFSSHPQLRTEPAFLRGEEWAKAAREIALKRWDTPNLTILIVYLLLGLHEFGTCHGGRSWMLAGMAQRMAFALLLHQDLDHNGWGKHASTKDTSEISPTDREIRRRTMWSCFLMDRFNASGTDRPMQMSEDFVNIPLPIKESFFQMELSASTETLRGEVLNSEEADLGTGALVDARQNMGTSAYYIKLVAIWGRLVQFWNMGGRERDKHPIWTEESELFRLRKDVDEFRDQLPPHMKWTAENLENHVSDKNANQFVFLHLVYYQARLFMSRWALPSSGFGRFTKNIPKTFIIESARAAIDAANNISVLIKEALEHNVTAPFAGYCAFYSSTVHVQGVFSKNPRTQESSKQNLAHNVKFLTKMKKYWGMFHFVTENLKDLYRQHADAMMKGSTDAPGKTDGILQYGDWFDRYPSGVSETDYEDPASQAKAQSTADTVLGQKSDLQSVEEFFASLSPATKAAQLRRQARKAKAKRTGETSAPDASVDALATSPTASYAQFGGQSLTPSTGIFGINGTGLEGAQTYNLLNNHNPLIQPPVVSQLDRRMVLSSYAGMDPSSASAIAGTMNEQQLGSLDQSNQFSPTGFDMWSMDGSGFGALGTDASTAWFMPFNLDPPTLSPEEIFSSSMMLGTYDFGGQDLGIGDPLLDSIMVDPENQPQQQ